MTLGHICLGIPLLPIVWWIMNRIWRTTQRWMRGFTPRQAYLACHQTLDRIVLHAWKLIPVLETQQPRVWMQYSVSQAGLLITPGAYNGDGSTALIPLTPWSAVSGVGLSISPIYTYAASARYTRNSTRINTGYEFNMLIVLIAGKTITIGLPLRNNDAAVDFAGHVLAFARHHERRLSLTGFDKDLTREVVHLEAF